MKKFLFTLVSLFMMLGFTSCEGDSMGGNAPKSVAGKTLKFYYEGSRGFTIEFSSNTSARIYNFDSSEYRCSSIEYKKTGPNTATLQMRGVDSIEYPGYPEDYNYSLIFISPNQGTAGASGLRTFELF